MRLDEAPLSDVPFIGKASRSTLKHRPMDATQVGLCPSDFTYINFKSRRAVVDWTVLKDESYILVIEEPAGVTWIHERVCRRRGVGMSKTNYEVDSLRTAVRPGLAFDLTLTALSPRLS